MKQNALPILMRALLLIGMASATLAAPATWIARSNQLAEPVLQAIARFDPEMASMTGKEDYDTEVVDLKPQRYERISASNRQLLGSLRAQLGAETDSHVRQDIQIMIDMLERQDESAKLQHEVMLDYLNVPERVFSGLRTLLDSRNRPERQAKALIRLKRYAGLEPGFRPMTELARQAQQEALARPGLTGPYRQDVLRGLDNTEAYIKGLEAEFTKCKLDGWQAPLATLASQLREHNAWLRTALLPRTRNEAKLPAAIYADNLREKGVDISPENLIERASADYLEVRDQMQVLATRIAAERNLPASDYRNVIRELKKKQLAPDAVLPMYWQRLRDIEAIVRREQLLTLPDRQPAIRLASEAESAQQPAPRMSPPRFFGNTGERGEFVLPTSNPNAKEGGRYDDFSHESATWTLAAHEARPGHELQFAAMIEQGVSIPRSLFAFNSANVEGWALYCEAMMLPYMPAEGQLFSLQARLQRMARAFLDPMVNLGRISPEGAKQFLMDDVVLSDAMAQQEADRYAFRDPGQATAYYYGYVQLRSLRQQTEIALGKRFNLRAFNDFVIAQGLLPPALLKKAVMEEFVPAQAHKG
ncbi:DUF885 domain-containing protein [Chitinimonas sp.]|uniref:DUF885 domain-containing protein n=1 Tax=Chitinimonas sp. TaxID=1934313 RepID=UPI0035B23D11